MNNKIILKLNRCKLIVAIFVIAFKINAQQTYFQQEVNYKIRVSLDDHAHTLSAFEEIEYINNSDKGLEYIYFHLWPNAYKDNSTALAKQLLLGKRTEFYYSKEEERGYIDSLDFKVNGEKIKWEYDLNNPDICKLILKEPLRSLDTIRISTPFFVKIPDAKFSRLGHTGQAYFVTQWYPKPAVYDNSGWHPMSYLDQGEFYSEFGSFDVSITLPENYLLSATGDRIDAAEEENFLNNKVGETLKRLDAEDYRENDMSFPESSPAKKTVRFKQFRVHDFAWFADKRFNVIHDQIELPNTRKTVDTWVFFTNKNFKLWKDAILYVNESTLFYSYMNGDYPYNHVTAVDGTIMAGGGMEYPNITVIGDMGNAFDLDITIAHEVGHNWFYGILGSNERDYPALDEGLNSFYELRYMRAKYPARKLIEYVGKDSTFNLLGANKVSYWREKELAYFFAARSRTDQPINTHAADFTGVNYGAIVYAKTAVVFDYLMDYMGEDAFDKAMQFYYEQFKFKHPTPSDLVKTLSYFSGMDMNWLTQHLILSTDKIDYKLKRVQRREDGSYSIDIKNKTGTATPVNVYGFKNGKPVGVVWFNGFTGSRNVGFPAADVDYFKIDGLDRMPDINRSNNFLSTRKFFPRAKPLQFNFLTKLEDPRKTQINYVPIGGYNYYNGPMLGVAIHNFSLLQNKFEYQIAPMFGFKSLTPAGFAEFNYNIYPRHRIQQITIGTKAKSFAYDEFKSHILNNLFETTHKNMLFNYTRISPFVAFEIKKQKANSNIDQFITYTANFLMTDSLNINAIEDYERQGPQKKFTTSFVNELNYSLDNHRAIHPFSLNFSLQHDDDMAKIFSVYNQKINVGKKHSFSLRIFAGTFVAGSLGSRSYYSFRSSGYNGYDDYSFKYNYLARHELSGLGANQFTETDGAMKLPSLGLGNSSEWMASVNIKSPRIFILPLRVYGDIVFTDQRFLYGEKFLYSAGLNIPIWKDIVDVYVPLVYSEGMKNFFEFNDVDFWQRIRFTLNIHKLAPKEFIRNNLF